MKSPTKIVHECTHGVKGKKMKDINDRAYLTKKLVFILHNQSINKLPDLHNIIKYI